MNSWIWRFLENYVYAIPEPPARVRTKPMEVLCVGLPRSGTESLQQALLKLGYDYTYHGWDILFERPLRIPAWARLARRKYYPLSTHCSKAGESTSPSQPLTAADFDLLIGHSVALTDAAASCFASDLITAYPDAKVILNVRSDINKWHASAVKNLTMVNESWSFYLLSWFSPEVFWMWHIYERLLWCCLFQCFDGKFASGINKNGLRIYREHSAMIKGLVPKERLLEWSVEDGWEPLCEFLGKDVPRDENGQVERFPNKNDARAFQAKGDQVMKDYMGVAVRNAGIVLVLFVAVGVGFYLMVR